MTPKGKYSKRCSLKIEYHYTDGLDDSSRQNRGTGFFIKGKNSYVYLITAKHTFSEIDNKENDNWENVEIEELEKNLALKVIVKKNNQKICDVHSIAFHHEDLIVFNVSLFCDEVENIKILYKEEYTEPNFFFYGFCKKKFQENLTSPTESDNPYLYTVQDTQSNNINAIKGCSGGGVFIEENGEFYLVGMLLQRYDAGVSFTVFNLPKYLNENPQEGFHIFNQKESEDTQKNVSLIDEVSEKESHIIPKDGYIEPRTVEIKELGIHVAVCPVTFEEYDLFCEVNPLFSKPDSFQFKQERGTSSVVNVMWKDADEYCKWISTVYNKSYRLLNSKEWESLSYTDKRKINIIKNFNEWCIDEDTEGYKLTVSDGKRKGSLLPYDSNDYLGFRIVYQQANKI